MTRARGQPKIGKHDKEIQRTLHFTMAVQPRLIHCSMTAELCRKYESTAFVKVCLSSSRCATYPVFLCLLLYCSFFDPRLYNLLRFATNNISINRFPKTLSLAEILLSICPNSPYIVSGIVEQSAVHSFHPSPADEVNTTTKSLCTFTMD
jgi:hypothetical protein